MGGNTSVIQKSHLPIDCNLIWNTHQDPQIEPNMSEQSQTQRMQYWLKDHPLKTNQTGFSGMERIEFTEERYVRFMLHIIDSGFANENPRSSGQKLNIVKIFPPNEPEHGQIRDEISNRIGNYILIRGSLANGKNQNWIKNQLPKLGYAQRLKAIKQLSSHDEINSFDSLNSAYDIENFIHERSLKIKNKLEKYWKDFANSQGVQLF